MKPYKWRTKNNGYVYVDSATGSDSFGNGTQDSPYQSLGKAWRGHSINKPGTIVCRGTFCEDMADGNHVATIMADYYGAAVFDGADTYTMYGFITPNMIFRNCAYGTYNTVVSGGSAVLAGVGRAAGAAVVGNAGHVFGVSASSVLLRGSAVYMGCIGGDWGVSKVGVVSPKPNPNHLFWYGGYLESSINQMSVYDVPKEYRRLKTDGTSVTFLKSIFGKCAFFINDFVKFRNCTFASDCTWWNGSEQFTPTGDTNEERMASLQDWITNTSISRKITLTDCILSAKTSEEIWNNPEMGDITLKVENADTDVLDGNAYRGAFPPALNIPILSDSTGITKAWDENTASGVITIADNKIVVSGTDASGSVKSKVITTDPDKIAIAGIFAQYANQFKAQNIMLSDKTNLGQSYNAGDLLPVGRYILKGGSAIYNDVYVAEGDVIVATTADKSFVASGEDEPTAYEIVDANAIDTIWLRTSQYAYILIKADAGLQAGATYININGKPITYRGRTIVDGESFEAENSTDTFTCEGDADYKIGILFDDTRVPQQPWIPANMWGEYFAGKVGSVYQTDSNGEYLGSGNYLSWLPASDGGYVSSIQKTRAHARYIQLMITAKR